MIPFQPLEIFLQPGDYYFGDKNTRIRTVLGSCVSLTFWHPQLLVGGMCHYMLPSRDRDRRGSAGMVPDGRYADEVVALMLQEIDAVGVPHREYHVKLFGGGNMFPDTHNSNAANIGQRNVETARMLVNKYGFIFIAEHLGGIGHRNVIFDVWSGEAWVRHREITRLGWSDMEIQKRRLRCSASK